MRLLPALALIAPSVSGPATASTYEYARPKDLEALVEDADRAVVGEVISTWTERAPSGLWSVASIVVDETLHGAHSPVIEVRWPGGKVGNIELVVAGAPSIHKGDTVLAFIDDQGQFVGMSQGAFLVEDGLATRDLSGLHFSGELEQEASYELDDIRARLR